MLENLVLAAVTGRAAAECVPEAAALQAAVLAVVLAVVVAVTGRAAAECVPEAAAVQAAVLAVVAVAVFQVVEGPV